MDELKQTIDDPEKNQKPKNSKKGFVAGLLVLVLAGGGGYYVYDQTKRSEANQAAVDSLALSVVKETLDYADTEPVNTLTLIKANGDVSADVEKIDVRKVGKTTVVYTVETLDSYGATATKTFEQEFEVVDNAAPVIELSDEEVSFYTGSSFAASDYITSVKDPVDGDLAEIGIDAEKPKDKGWYTITSDVATDTAGNYTVKIHAEDKNGNKTDKEFAVMVSEKPVSATTTYNNTANTYAAPNNYSGYSGGYNDYSGYSDNSGYSGGGGYSDSGGSSYVAETPTETYTEPAPPAVDYSIPAGSFASYDEANSWGMSQVMGDAVPGAWGYYVDAYTTAAGVPYYVVTFKY